MMAKTVETARRGTPKQDRGARRVDALIDAAFAIVAERGFEALTLTEVAERSNSAIGSLYRFFASKDELVTALVERLVAAADENESLPEDLSDLAPDAFVRAFTQTIAATVARTPALPALLHHLGEQCRPLEVRTMAPLDRYIRAKRPRLRPKARAIIARFALDIVAASLAIPARVPEATPNDALAELRFVLTAYLDARLGEGDKGAPGP